MTDDTEKHIQVSPAAVECCQRALAAWGEKAQILMMMEEMGELTTALAHHVRGRATPGAVVDEVADVLFMALQMREMLGPEKVDARLHEKVTRLQGRLDEAEEKRASQHNRDEKKAPTHGGAP